MKIQVRVQNNYGVNAIYPVCLNALGFARIARTKTLSAEAIETIKELGFEVENVTQAITL